MRDFVAENAITADTGLPATVASPRGSRPASPRLSGSGDFGAGYGMDADAGAGAGAREATAIRAAGDGASTARGSSRGAAAVAGGAGVSRGTSAGGGAATGKRTDYGEVPAYLKARQAEWAAAEAARKKAAEEADVPAGMRVMPEAERLETLDLLRSGIAEAQAELSRFKLRVVVPSHVARKAELEAKIDQLEKAMGVFSKTRVLVKIA